MDATQLVEVPVSHPAHPSHKSVLEIMLNISRFIASIAPVGVVIAKIVDPGDAKLIDQIGTIVAISTAPPAASQ